MHVSICDRRFSLHNVCQCALKWLLGRAKQKRQPLRARRPYRQIVKGTWQTTPAFSSSICDNTARVCVYHQLLSPPPPSTVPPCVCMYTVCDAAAHTHHILCLLSIWVSLDASNLSVCPQSDCFIAQHQATEYSMVMLTTILFIISLFSGNRPCSFHSGH